MSFTLRSSPGGGGSATGWANILRIPIPIRRMIRPTATATRTLNTVPISAASLRPTGQGGPSALVGVAGVPVAVEVLADGRVARVVVDAVLATDQVHVLPVAVRVDA